MHYAKPFNNDNFGLNIKNAKSMHKTTLLAHYSCFMQKTALKQLTFEKWEHFKNGKIVHYAKGKAFAWWGVKIENAGKIMILTVILVDGYKFTKKDGLHFTFIWVHDLGEWRGRIISRIFRVFQAVFCAEQLEMICRMDFNMLFKV